MPMAIYRIAGYFRRTNFRRKAQLLGKKISHAFIFGQPGLGPKYTCDYYRYVMRTNYSIVGFKFLKFIFSHVERHSNDPKLKTLRK